MPKFNIAQVAVTHTCYYEPSVYLEHCESLGIEPSEEQYLEYIQDEINEDFPFATYHKAEITYHEAD